MAAVGSALPIIGMVLGIGSSIAGGMADAEAARMEGKAISQAEEENATIAEQNKIIANEKRIVDVQTADADAADNELNTRRALATIRTAFGGSGVSMSGSPIDLLTDAAVTAGKDTARIRQEGQQRNREGVLRILGYERDRVSALSRAKYARDAASRGVTAAGINTVARLSRAIS